MGEPGFGEQGGQLELYRLAYRAPLRGIVVELKSKLPTFKRMDAPFQVESEGAQYSVTYLNAGAQNTEADLFQVTIPYEDRSGDRPSDRFIIKLYRERTATTPLHGVAGDLDALEVAHLSGSLMDPELTSRSPEEAIREQALAHHHTQGIERVPSLVTFSPEDRVIIMQEMPGKSFEVLRKQPDRIPLTREHIVQMVETMVRLHHRGVTAETQLGNFLIDHNFGMSIVDIHPFSEDNKIVALYNIATLYNAVQHYCETPLTAEPSAAAVMQTWATAAGAKQVIREILDQQFPTVVADMKTMEVIQDEQFTC